MTNTCGWARRQFPIANLLVKNPHFSLSNLEIENLPLIHLQIYKKIFVSSLPSQKCGFFTNKPKISKICYVSKTFLCRIFLKFS